LPSGFYLREGPNAKKPSMKSDSLSRNLKAAFFSTFFVLSVLESSHAQDYNFADPFYSYYYDYKIANPALTGTKAKHLITTVFHGIPKTTIDNKIIYASYERNISSIKSGIGGVFLYDQFGPWIDRQANVLFSKQISFNEKSGLYLGTQLLYNHRELDFSKFKFLDSYDPLIVEGDYSRSRFNFDLGTAYYSPLGTFGVSVKNILREKNDDIFLRATDPTLVLLAFRDFTITKNFVVTPSIMYKNDFEYGNVSVNANIEVMKWVILGGSYSFRDGDDRFMCNAGINIKDWVQIVTHLYSSFNDRFDDYDPTVETMIRVTIPHPDSEK
jgi:type IX secretion system PorP/SprF family membrane protein